MNTFKRHRLPPDVIHDISQYANNRAEQSHENTRVWERLMRWSGIPGIRSASQAQQFLGAHAAAYNLFNLGRHLVFASHHRNLRISAFKEWGRAVT